MKDFQFKKKFGQNFISDKNLLIAISNDANLSIQDEVLEIGAGAGSLTEILSGCAKKVISFEIDKDLQAHLESLNLKNVEFIFQDFMKFDMKELENKFTGKYKVVANLPYYITTPIIFKFLEEAKKVESLTIMVQKEVAERICAKPDSKDYGILTVMLEFYGNSRICRIINRNMFFPAPNVDSALINIEICPKYPTIDKHDFFNFIKVCFSMRRKTLLNNLSSRYSKDFLKNKLDEKVLKMRSEDLSLKDFVNIYEKLN